VLFAGTLLALAGLGLESLNAITGVPFGSIVYSPGAGPLLFHLVPWSMPFLWVLILLNARGLARLLLAPARKNPRYGLYVLGLTALLMVTFDLSFQPFAVRIADYWNWTSEPLVPGWLEAPWGALLSRGLASLIIMGLVTPVLINKKPSSQPSLNYPLLFWLLLLLFFLTGAVMHRLWPAFGMTLVQLILIVALARHTFWARAQKA
jgi:uncharacterized membrane protein